MSITQVIKQSWRAVWDLRVLWIFGFLIAITTISIPWWLGPVDVRNGDQEGIIIRFSQNNTWHFLSGAGLKIDLSTPDGPKVWIQEDYHWVQLDSPAWPELNQALRDMNARSLVIFLVVEAITLMVLAILLRYTSESAIIRGVNFYALNGEKPGFGYSLRQGWSRTAAKMLAIDLLIAVAGVIVVGSTLWLSLSPLYLWNSGSTTAGVLGTGLALVLLAPWILLFILFIAAASVLRQVFWRACAVDELGVLPSIGKGFATIRHNLAKVLGIWLTWLATVLLWALFVIPLLVLLSPLFLVSIFLGAALCLIPGLIVAGIASLFVNGIAVWIMAAMAAVPIFLVVTFSPVTFAAGLMRLFQSNLWTLMYRQLPATKQVETIEPIQSGRPQAKPLSL